MAASEPRPGGGPRVVVLLCDPQQATAPSGRRLPRWSDHGEGRRQTGRRLILAGFAVSCVGTAGYCAACFSGGLNADLGDILLGNAVPLARVALGVLAMGTLAWLAGSCLYLAGALEAEEPGDAPEPGIREFLAAREHRRDFRP